MKARGGFTLIEVLVTALLLAILLPVVNQGIAAATRTGGAAIHRTEAAGLGQSKLAEIAASTPGQGGNSSGDFGPDWRDYRWASTVQPWPEDNTGAGIQQIDLTVTWTARGREESVTLSTLAYPRGQQ